MTSDRPGDGTIDVGTADDGTGTSQGAIPDAGTGTPVPPAGGTRPAGVGSRSVPPGPAGQVTYWAEAALLPAGLRRGVRVGVDRGRITGVQEGTAPRRGEEVLGGVVWPGAANTHSHAFHRALRGWTHAGSGDFWTWREQMYALAAALDPDSCFAIARAVYAEMVLAGWSAVGEFHYVHHSPAGPYPRPAVMAEALVAAAAEAGIRLVLLDTCYLAAGPGQGPSGVQRRFADVDAAAWARRFETLARAYGPGVGAAIHSVRAVPPEAAAHVAAVARAHDAVVHVHVAEQPAEVSACLAAHGRTPVQVLADAGVLGARTTAVHAVHLTPGDIGLLADTGTSVALCPTTERDLGDGIAPAAALARAGVPLCVGSDQHVVVDPFAEVRAVEEDERLAHRRRGVLGLDVLHEAWGPAGHRALGRIDAGRIAPGAPADLVAVRTDSVRTAGVDAAQLLMAASAADVTDVLVAGRRLVTGGRHVLGDVGALGADAVARLRAAARSTGDPR